MTAAHPDPGSSRSVTVARIGCAAAAVAAGLLAVVGLLAQPAATLTLIGIAVLFVAPLTAMCVYSTDPEAGRAVRLGALAAASLTAVGLVAAGLVVLLASAAVPVIAVILVATGLGVWRRGRIWQARVLTIARLRPTRGRDVPARPDPRPADDPVLDTARPVVPTVSVSTPELCAAWRHTYWLLRDLPTDGPERPMVIDARRRLLDEFERRDPDGFGRWMQTEPHACSDPGRYLTAGPHRRRAR